MGCDLKAAPMDVQRQLIFYDFESGHNVAEVIKNICRKKGEVAVDHNAITRWLKKFWSGFKKLDDQVMSGKLNQVDSEAVFQDSMTNSASSTR